MKMKKTLDGFDIKSDIAEKKKERKFEARKIETHQNEAHIHRHRNTKLKEITKAAVTCGTR